MTENDLLGRLRSIKPYEILVCTSLGVAHKFTFGDLGERESLDEFLSKMTALDEQHGVLWLSCCDSMRPLVERWLRRKDALEK